MTTNTTYYNLKLYDNTGDKTALFETFRADQAGIGVSSNMNLIDGAMNDLQTEIDLLDAYKGAIRVSASVTTPNTVYSATVAEITALSTNLQIALSLNSTNDASPTLNISALGAKLLMKYDGSGALVSLAAKDMIANRISIFVYNGTQWIWIGGTSSDQINIPGTSGNFVSINANNNIVDSTYDATDFALAAKGVTNGDSHDHNGGDGAQIPTGGIVDGAITYAKIQDVSATDKILGRQTSGSGDVEEITCTSFARTILDDTTASAVRTTIGVGDVLTADRNYYVNPSTGSDSNTGLSSVTAFATIAKAIDTCTPINTSGYNITINLADGTYITTGAGIRTKAALGSGIIYIVGNETTPTNVIINSTGVGISATDCTTKYSFKGMSFECAGAAGQYAIVCNNSNIEVRNVAFSPDANPWARHFVATGGGNINITAGYRIRETGFSYSLDSQFFSTITMIGATVLLDTGALIDWTGGAFAFARRIGQLRVETTTFTLVGGTTVAGARYSVSENSVVFTSATTFPGSIAGSTATGGIYI
jgi:hypothetical protein